MTNYQNLPYKVIGIDTSHWEGRIDARKTLSAGAYFIMPKATHGVNVDPQFFSTWKSAKGLLKRSAFHWLTIETSIREQAKAFAAVLKDDPGEIEPYVDFEEPAQFWARRNPVTGKRGWNQTDISQVRRENEEYRQENADLRDWAERLIRQLAKHAPHVEPEKFIRRKR